MVESPDRLFREAAFFRALDPIWALLLRIVAASSIVEVALLELGLPDLLAIGCGAILGTLLALLNARVQTRRSERVLALEHRRFRSLYESHVDAVAAIATNGTYLHINAAAELLFDRQAGELVGEHLTRFIDPLAIRETTERFARTLHGETVDYDLTLLRKNGASVIASVRALPMQSDGIIVGAWLVMRDVTEERRSNAVLRSLARTNEDLALTTPVETALRRLAADAAHAVCGSCAIYIRDRSDRLVAVTEERADDALDWAQTIMANGRAMTLGEIGVGVGGAAEERLLVPLCGRIAPLGMLVLTARPGWSFGEAQRYAARLIAERISLVYDNARIFEGEARIASLLQEASLPRALPSIPGVVFDAIFEPSGAEARVGGDWYDVFRLPDGRVGITIGDICGNGLAAAVMMGRLRQAMQSAAMIDADPIVMLDAADLTLRLHESESVSTALAAIYDPVTSCFTFASAGHPMPIIRKGGRRVALPEIPDPPLGLRECGEGRCTVVETSEGAFIALYTDGLIEATRDVLEGEARLLHAIADERVRYNAHPARAIRDAVLDRTADDDVSILTFSISSRRVVTEMHIVEGGVPEKGLRVAREFVDRGDDGDAVHRDAVVPV